MSRRCDTAKYRKRAERARQNRQERAKRLVLEAAVRYRAAEERRRRDDEARKREPRYQLLCQLVGILQARLNANPLYQYFEIARLFGCDPESLLASAVETALGEAQLGV